MKIVGETFKYPTPDNPKRSLQSIGLLLIFFGVLSYCAFEFISTGMSEHALPFFTKFTIVVTSFYIVTGIGAFFQTKWGYYLLRILTILLLICFPIGTYFGYLLYRLLKKDEVQLLFNRNSS